jgi:8-oxo-dGTP pyrophosphatase MutT (NUDIX family)
MEKPPLDIVRSMLASHSPADSSETDSLRRINALVATGEAPFSRAHYIPGHLTASAIVLDESREHALLIFHAKLHLWLQPGGHFETGESDPSIAAAREVLEETGLTARWPGATPVLHDVDVHSIPARKTEPQHFHFDLRMLLISPRLPVAPGDDGVAAARWVGRDEALSMNLDPGLQRALRKIWK